MDTKNFKQALEVLEDAKSQVKEILTGDEASSILLRITAGLNTGITALSHASGSANTAFATSTETKPITKFMGKAIERKDSNVSQEQLSIDEQEKQIFIDKVNNLYERISGLDSVEVLKIHTIPEDVLALRGVAKKAGVADFESAELDVKFIDTIKAKIAINKAEGAATGKVLDDDFTQIDDPEESEVTEETNSETIPGAKSETVQQRIDRINSATTIDEVAALIEGEDRKKVLEVAERRIAKL